MRNLVFAAMLAATVATPVFAQDGGPSFTGPRVEGIVGWDRAGNDRDRIGGVGRDSGVTYGVGVGYDRQFGNIVAGVDAELTDSSAKPDDIAGTRANFGRDIYVGGRIGTVVGGRTLLYAKAGYTNARAKLTSTVDGVTASDHTNLDGVRVGAGAEYALTGNMFLKAEYRYSNYQDGFDRQQVVGGFGFRF